MRRPTAAIIPSVRSSRWSGSAPIALGASIADPLIGLAITLVILRITWQSWNTVRGHDHHHG